MGWQKLRYLENYVKMSDRQSDLRNRLTDFQLQCNLNRNSTINMLKMITMHRRNWLLSMTMQRKKIKNQKHNHKNNNRIVVVWDRLPNDTTAANPYIFLISCPQFQRKVRSNNCQWTTHRTNDCVYRNMQSENV